MTENDVNAISAKANDKNAAERTKGFDSDGYYKDLIECFFYPLLKRAAPKLYKIADTTVKPRFLDKEFRDVLNTADPDIHTSPHFVDFVIEVPTKDGRDEWILCHVEARASRVRYQTEHRLLYGMPAIWRKVGNLRRCWPHLCCER